MNELHEMIKTLEQMGATKEDIIALWGMALETTDKIVKE